jgi:hypothetical protein
VLDKLTVDDFLPEVGREFPVASRGQGMALQLTSATPSRRAASGTSRAGFSLLFRAPVAFGVAQGTFRVVHPRLGALDIFLVPVGATAETVEFEAVFN